MFDTMTLTIAVVLTSSIVSVGGYTLQQYLQARRITQQRLRIFVARA